MSQSHTTHQTMAKRGRIAITATWHSEHNKSKEGAQLLSGRVLDSRPRGRGFEPHRRHCIVVHDQDTFILA